jgi:hypothetical protein
VIWVVLGDFGVKGGVRKTFMIGIDRARRFSSGTSLGTVLDTKEANPFVFFNNFHVFSVFFCSFFDFRTVGGGGYFWKFFLESIELIKFYLESVRAELERTCKRIR